MMNRQDLADDRFVRHDRMLYAWGDEVRTRTDELGLPRMSGLAGIVRRQQLSDEQHAARGGTRRKVETLRRFGVKMRRCRNCRHEHRASLLQCPKCDAPLSPKEVEYELRRELGAFESHGAGTRSMKPPTLREFSAITAAIEAIVLAAPSGATELGVPSVQTILLRRYLHGLRPRDEAKTFMVRKDTYKEWVAAAVEYVAEKLAQQRGRAL